MEQRPLVGVGTMIFKDGKILLGRRKGSHGAGEWAFPGGHLEYMESFEECALREIAEECGVEITNLQFQSLGNLTTYAPKHYVNICMMADWKSGDPQVLEPDKMEQWQWFDLNNLPSPLFAFSEEGIKCYKINQIYLSHTLQQTSAQL